MFKHCEAFDQTWCSKSWAGSGISRHDFANGPGLAFCCFPGTFFHCVNCKADFPSNYGKTSAESGRKETENSAYQCLDCPAGFITTSPNTLTLAEIKSNSRNACKPGEYQDEKGQFKCKACESGKYSEEVGASNKNQCLDCPKGKYVIAMGSGALTDCNDCTPGKYSSETGNKGLDKCKNCAANTASKEEGLTTSCKSCGPGEYQTETGKANCMLCDLGKFGSREQAGKCVECKAGMYQDGKGQQACKNCPVDTYSNEEGKSSSADCTACPEKTTTNKIQGCTKESSCVCQDKFYLDPSSTIVACKDCIEEQTNCR